MDIAKMYYDGDGHKRTIHPWAAYRIQVGEAAVAKNAKLRAENTKLKKLASTYSQYVTLLNEELDELVGYASTHGWQSTRVEAGKQLRRKIAALKE